MNKYSFSRPDDAVKAFNAAHEEISGSDEFSWVTDILWGNVSRIDEDSTADEIAESIESMLYVCVDGYSETYDNRVAVSFFDNVRSWSSDFVNNIILECSDKTADELFELAYEKKDDEAISAICELNKCIIYEGAQYFVHIFCKHYGVRYDDFWNNQVI